MEMDDIRVQYVNLVRDACGNPFHRPVCLLTVAIEEKWQHVDIGTEYRQRSGQRGVAFTDTGIAAGLGLDEQMRFDVEVSKSFMNPPGSSASASFMIECIDMQNTHEACCPMIFIALLRGWRQSVRPYGHPKGLGNPLDATCRSRHHLRQRASYQDRLGRERLSPRSMLQAFPWNPEA